LFVRVFKVNAALSGLVAPEPSEATGDGLFGASSVIGLIQMTGFPLASWTRHTTYAAIAVSAATPIIFF
jgi:hypothetical protein